MTVFEWLIAGIVLFGVLVRPVFAYLTRPTLTRWTCETTYVLRGPDPATAEPAVLSVYEAPIHVN
jgi:hypothetical protein